MNKQRLESFSDATVAIIMTIMVLELEVPKVYDWNALFEVLPVFTSYVLSFLIVGLFWYNHHRLFSRVTKVNSYVLWFNLAALFLQSLLPFTTAWVGQSRFAPAPVALYALVNGCSKVLILPVLSHLRKLHGPDSELSKEYPDDFRIYLTIVMDFVAAFVAASGYPRISFGIMAVVTVVWFFPNAVFRLKRAK